MIQKKKKLNEEEKYKKVEGNIKNIDVGSRIKDKEIDSSKINQKENMATVKKLPKSKYGVVKKNKKKKKEENVELELSASGSGSDSAGEEENKDGSQGSGGQSSEQNQQSEAQK